ncbi:MAG TPA: helix-turn-helix transcriptional regulator [Phenylobacterium sp.]
MSDEVSNRARPDYRALLAAALRGIREDRRLRIADVARAMNMPVRSYEHFEAGRGRFDLERLHRFAEVTDSDPFAILASALLQAPEFAVRAADNKPMVVFMLGLRDFHDDLRDDITLIEPRVFVGAFRRVFQDLAEHVRKRDLTAETWLDSQARKIGLNLSFGRARSRKR